MSLAMFPLASFSSYVRNLEVVTFESSSNQPSSRTLSL
jgi:hypothetical protein